MDTIPALVIFDMDGVLVNSEGAFRRACTEALHRWGVTPAYAEFQPFTGMGDELYIGGVSRQHGVEYVPEMTDVSYRLYEKYAPEDLQVFDWSKRVLESLYDRGVPICVASSAGAFKVNVNLRCIGVSPSIFSAIITGSDVEKKKPAPDIFLTAAARCGISPEKCLVMEDALSGVAAAKAAGMRVTAVSTSFTKEELAAAGADFVCDDLTDAVCHWFGWDAF